MQSLELLGVAGHHTPGSRRGCSMLSAEKPEGRETALTVRLATVAGELCALSLGGDS